MRRPLDTSPEARERQLEAYRAMTPAARLRLAAELSAAVQALSEAGRRSRAERATTDTFAARK